MVDNFLYSDLTAILDSMLIRSIFNLKNYIQYAVLKVEAKQLRSKIKIKMWSFFSFEMKLCKLY